MKWLASITTVPADVLKSVSALLGGLAIAAGTYALGRLKELKAKAAADAGARVSLSPEDRDLAHTLARTGTDLTRALHDHGELPRRGLPAPPWPRPRAPPPSPHREARAVRKPRIVRPKRVPNPKAVARHSRVF